MKTPPQEPVAPSQPDYFDRLTREQLLATCRDLQTRLLRDTPPRKDAAARLAAPTGEPEMSTPRIYTPETLKTLQVSVEIEPGRWVAHRPEGFWGLMLRHRLKCAWLVFTAKADVLMWEGQP